eukprot:TRINITY_DN2163_c0_g1_i2.p1 TRINITY_DN2163_c0_g1~~TRINITY_DN2163_c0_g1_i2.p1  ORF type:complete len:474 (+),score=110.56 TRINITY_DN2163_c0_g1_i2:305-1726(+)
MTIGEFVLFTGAYSSSTKHIRILRDNDLSKYMLLLLLENQESADSFFKEYNGKPFSSLSPEEVCKVAFVRKVDFTHPKKAALFPPTGQAELPTCSICLEKLDSSISGLLTIMCNHSFHCQCLIGWRDENRCPICRYTQTPSGEHSVCSTCGINSSLMICLVCGFIGCSKSGHSEEHFNEFQHTYAMELETQRAWDFSRQGYVNRLVANEADNKLVAIPDERLEEMIANTLKSTDGLDREEAREIEWQYLIEAHVESQRKYYEDQINLIERQNEKLLHSLKEEYSQLLEERSEAVTKVENIEKQKKLLERRNKELEKKMMEIQKETEFLKDINGAMTHNQQAWAKKVQETENKINLYKVTSKDEKIKELEEQVKSLMTYIETQNSIQANNPSISELQDSHVVLINHSPPKSARKKKPNQANNKHDNSSSSSTTTTTTKTTTTKNQQSQPKTNTSSCSNNTNNNQKNTTKSSNPT